MADGGCEDCTMDVTKDWKIRQQIYHQMNQEDDFGDDLRKEIIVEEWDKSSIILRASSYPVKQTKELYYPGKSYAIGVIFAKLLEKHFKENFYEVLDDPELLYGNDPYFVPYSKDKETYDKIIESFPWETFENEERACENFKLTTKYFKEEFMLDKF